MHYYIIILVQQLLFIIMCIIKKAVLSTALSFAVITSASATKNNYFIGAGISMNSSKIEVKDIDGSNIYLSSGEKLDFKKSSIGFNLTAGKEFSLTEKLKVASELAFNYNNSKKEIKDEGSSISFSNQYFIGLGSRLMYSFEKLNTYAGLMLGSQGVKSEYLLVGENESIEGSSAKNMLSLGLTLGLEKNVYKNLNAFVEASYILPLSKVEVASNGETYFSKVKATNTSVKIGARYFF